MVIVNDKINDDIEMYLHCSLFWRPCRCAGATQMASTNAACPRLPRKPLDAAIGPNEQQSTNTPKKVAILMTAAVCWYDTAASPNGWGPGLHWKWLDATIGQVLRPIDAIGHAYAVFFQVFSL